jgi:hypothetical protein
VVRGAISLIQLDPFAAQRELEIGKAREIASRPRQTGDQAGGDRIAHLHEHDRNLAGFAAGRDGHRSGVGDQQIAAQFEQLLDGRPHALGVAGGPAIVDLKVAALGPAEPRERLLERADAGLRFGIALSEPHHHADAPHRIARLSARGERTRQRRAGQRGDELPPSDAACHPTRRLENAQRARR